MDKKQEALKQLVYEEIMEDRFAMETSLFSRWWEIALFLLLGLLLLPTFLLFLPLFILLYLWEYLKKEKVDD